MRLYGKDLKVLHRDWYKRREPGQTNKNIEDVNVVQYKQEHNHFCTIIVWYDNDDIVDYIGRVVYNDIKNYWTVDGMHVAVRVK